MCVLYLDLFIHSPSFPVLSRVLFFCACLIGPLSSFGDLYVGKTIYSRLIPLQDRDDMVCLRMIIIIRAIWYGLFCFLFLCRSCSSGLLVPVVVSLVLLLQDHLLQLHGLPEKSFQDSITKGRDEDGDKDIRIPVSGLRW